MQANIFYTWRVLGDCFKDFCATFNLMFRNKNHMNEGFLNGRCFTPWKINIIMEVWKIIFLSKWLISRFHVNLPGCKFPNLPSRFPQKNSERFVNINGVNPEPIVLESYSGDPRNGRKQVGFTGVKYHPELSGPYGPLLITGIPGPP